MTAASPAGPHRSAWNVPYVLAMSVAAFVLSFCLYLAVRPGDALTRSDIPHYYDYAAAVADGRVPYRDFQLEYPPASLPIFLLPATPAPGLASTDGAVWAPPNAAAFRYHDRFVVLVLLLGVGIVSATALSLGALHRSAHTAIASLGILVLSPWLLGDLLPERFDVWPAALTAAALALAVRGRYVPAAGVTAVAAAAKLYPLLLLPVLIVAAARDRGLRVASASGAVAVAVVAAIVAPFALVSPSGTWDALRIQFQGGLHIETLASAALVLASDVSRELASLGLPGPFSLTDREAEHGLGRGVLVGPGTGPAATTLTLLLLVGLAFVWVSLLRSKGDPREDLVRYSAATVSTAVALGSVLSPQYLVWLLPLVVLVGGRRGLVAMGSLVLAAVLTHVWFRWIYTSYARDLDAGTASFLLARNVLLLAIAVVLVLPTSLAPARLRRGGRA